MPIYEYTCGVCGHAFEHLARTLSDKPDRCPACGAKKIAKQLSAFAPAVSAPRACRSCANESACAAPAAHGGCGCSCACHHHG